MRNYREHLLRSNANILAALVQLDKLAKDAILFIVDDEDKLIGSLTDGDVRRGLINGYSTYDSVIDIIQHDARFLKKGEIDLNKVIEYREGNYRILPILDNNNIIINVINFRTIRSYLPIDAVIMAGGKGQRLKPLTDFTPKPLLLVGGKPIMEHNLERLALYGVDDFWVSIKYLGDQIQSYFKDGADRNIKINYVREDEPLGTIGAISKIDHFVHDYVLVTNSDILTNLDYEKFFLDFLDSGVDLAIVTIPYQVNIPYAVLETKDRQILNFKEKPTYTYFSNGGIYLMKRAMVDMIPKETFYNATDLLENLLKRGFKVSSYPLSGYWLDIGRHEDFEKAQNDIKLINF